MKQFIFLLGLLLFSPYQLISQGFQDCESAFPICELKTYHFNSMEGWGRSHFNTEGLKCTDGNFRETNAIWLEWEVEKEGAVTFVISPKSKGDDLDFILFRSAGNCSEMEEMRCMASGLEIGANNTSDLCSGATGINYNSLDIFEKQGCKYNDDNFLKFLNTDKEETYLLLVNNYESSKGFSISLEGNARLKSLENCLDENQTHVFISSIFPNPSDEKVFVDFVVGKTEEVQISLVTMNGHELQNHSMIPEEGLNRFDVDVGSYLPGSYLMKVEQDGRSALRQFVKK